MKTPTLFCSVKTCSLPLIANADHVPQLQRRKETMNLFTTFLKGESIDNLDGIISNDARANEADRTPW